MFLDFLDPIDKQIILNEEYEKAKKVLKNSLALTRAEQIEIKNYKRKK